jgi:mono/diheme cytochrome c family protein
LRTANALLFVVAILLVSIGFAQSSGNVVTSNPVYEKNCAKCHGKTGEGRHFGGPSLVSDDVRNMSADDLRNVITDGKHRMPKFAGKLTPEEIDSLVTQIKAGGQK